MKQRLALALVTVVLFTIFTAYPASEAAYYDIETPTDVPKVIITLNDSGDINRNGYTDCTITIIDEKGGIHTTINDEGSSIKIRGNSTSSGAKKPYNIKLSQGTRVLGIGKAKKWSLLSNCFDKTLIRNKTVFDFADHTVLDYSPDSIFVDVYLVDSYGTQFLGNYQLCESVEIDGSRVDIQPENNEFLVERDVREDDTLHSFYTSLNNLRFAIKDPELEDLTASQKSYVENMFDNAERALNTKKMSELKKYFDIESMVDFYIVNEYFKSVDVAITSTFFYIEDGLIHGGPLWDYDLSSGNANSGYYKGYNNVNTTGNSWEGIYAAQYSGVCIWFNKLINCTEFMNLVKERYIELYPYIENLYTDNDCDGDGDIDRNYIDTLVERYEGTLHRNYTDAGWSMTYPYSIVIENNPYERYPDSTYKENLEYFRRWLKNRNDWLMSYWGLNAPDTGSSGELPDSDIGEKIGLDPNYEIVNVAPDSSYVITSGVEVDVIYNTSLNDGEAQSVSANWSEGTWYGFCKNPQNGKLNVDTKISASGNYYGVVTFDLGSPQPIQKVRLHLCNNEGAGIYGPWGIYAIPSNTNSFPKEKRIGVMSGNGGLSNSSYGDYWVEIDVAGNVSQYIQFQIGLGGEWCFINEIEIYVKQKIEEPEPDVSDDSSEVSSDETTSADVEESSHEISEEASTDETSEHVSFDESDNPSDDSPAESVQESLTESITESDGAQSEADTVGAKNKAPIWILIIVLILGAAAIGIAFYIRSKK